MTYEEAIEQACEVYGLDKHQKEIMYKKDCHTFAEKIADAYTCEKKPYHVKNSYMYLDRFDFCFFFTGRDVAYSLSGVCMGADQNKIADAIAKANAVCIYANYLLRKEDKNGRTDDGV